MAKVSASSQKEPFSTTEGQRSTPCSNAISTKTTLIVSNRSQIKRPRRDQTGNHPATSIQSASTRRIQTAGSSIPPGAASGSRSRMIRRRRHSPHVEPPLQAAALHARVLHLVALRGPRLDLAGLKVAFAIHDRHRIQGAVSVSASTGTSFSIGSKGAFTRPASRCLSRTSAGCVPASDK